MQVSSDGPLIVAYTQQSSRIAAHDCNASLGLSASWQVAELGESGSHGRCGRSLVERGGERGEDLVVGTEVGEMLEGEVDGAGELALVAQAAKLGVLAAAASHGGHGRRQA